MLLAVAEQLQQAQQQQPEQSYPQMIRSRRSPGPKSQAGEISASSSGDQSENSFGNHNNSMVKQMVSHNEEQGDKNQMEPLLLDKSDSSSPHLPLGGNNDDDDIPASKQSAFDAFFALYCRESPDFFKQAAKLTFCFCALQASYLTWGYMQELIMTTQFTPTPLVPSGKFPSAAFCVFSNRFLAVIVAMIAVKLKHGAVFTNNTAPLLAFTPCALSNTVSSWSQYASLKYVTFPVQTVFKSSKIIPVMVMGKVLKGTSYPLSQYIEALLITTGVAIFSILSKPSHGDRTAATEIIGLLYMVVYVFSDSFTSQWQDKVYSKYGKAHVDQYQMMLGVNVSAICMTSFGLIVSGDIPVVLQFLAANPNAFHYNIITAITSASGQLSIFYTIKEFGPIVFTIIMTTRQMFSICLSAIIFKHHIPLLAACGAGLVFAVLFYQIQGKYRSRKGGSRNRKQQTPEIAPAEEPSPPKPQG